MEGRLAVDYIGIGLYLLVGIGFYFVTIGAAWVLSPHKLYDEKLSIYECGVEPIGPPWVQFRLGYYVYALLYVLFDIETVFLYPWAVVVGKATYFVLFEMIVFIVILFAGLIFAWREGALRWR